MKRTVPFSANTNVEKSLIKPCCIKLLLYCSHCWSPSITSLKKLFSMLRKCQRREIGFYDYQKQLQICNIVSISIETMCRDAGLIYKLYSGLYDLQFNDFFIISAERRRIYVTPTYKFEKRKFNSTFTKRTAR